MQIGETSNLAESVKLYGIAALDEPMPETMLTALDHIFEDASPAGAAGRRLAAANDNANGPVDAVLSFLRSFPPFQQAVQDILGPHAVAWRMLFFRKSRDVNWLAAWHQDVTIAAKNSHPLQPAHRQDAVVR